MAKKITGNTASGQALPEIRPGDKWQDKSGGEVLITGYQFNRVNYIRDGYTHPCISSVDRFRRDFSRVEVQSFTGWRELNKPLEKVRKLRSQINASREVAK
ncbi:DUF4222 domain-containing protein [Salmonella enterica subsp. enterica]|nr:DUF4222 domain-containing protein [Salmonella enterica subsp. enterica serovar Agbeni]EHW4298973.1 DUF4222 domain-containing protein [Salmonella enterica subsp. enterica serovar Agbeni]EHW4299849.1 DUF4222 domain-containing protein [Salmonella enterica subsp. enterica serovar Agbeni]EHX6081752.1 DUF4222 domain-containing protein [Salmonella enterica subsp. enterica serovar Agbeni]EHX6084139.1 DUF4222 domain-containing protein [Salmonella enterica subsp. enterica serovar Agbeni]